MDSQDKKNGAPAPNQILDKWIDNVRQAASGGPDRVRNALNKSAYVIGMQIPKGRVDEKTATAELIAAGIQAGLEASHAEYTVRTGIRDGKKKELAAIDGPQGQEAGTKSASQPAIGNETVKQEGQPAESAETPPKAGQDHDRWKLV